MPSAPTDALLVSAVATAAACIIVLRLALTWHTAFAIAAVKILVTFIYFRWFYTGEWTVIDDVAYFRQGRILLDAGFNPFSVLAYGNGLVALMFLSDGYHFLYGWFNLTMQFVLGPWYHSAVFGNVFLTCICAVLVHGLARDTGAPTAYARGLAAFTALHWELVAWSGFINVKDILVLTLTLALLRALVAVNARASLRGVVSVILLSFVLLWIRFYVPIVALFAWTIYRIAAKSEGARLRRSLFAVAVLALVLVVARARVVEAFALIDVTASDVVFGWIRTLLSPQPWSTQRAYGFLQVPAILHLATLPLAVYGAALLARGRSELRFLMLYAALLLVPVAAYPELQGPRHRIQIMFLVAWAQFHGAYAAARFVQFSRLTTSPATG